MAACKSFLALALLLLAAGAAQAKTPKTVAEAVVANKDDGLGLLLEVVQAADPAILKTLSDPSLSATVFAPTDAAFKKLLKVLGVTKKELLKNKALLTKVLQYHVVPAPVEAADLKRTQVVQTLLKGAEGKLRITARRSHGDLTVRLFTTSGGKAKVLTPDVIVGHSVIHIVNHVLVPGNKKHF